MNGALAAIFGAPAFQLPATFLMILQLATGMYKKKRKNEKEKRKRNKNKKIKRSN